MALYVLSALFLPGMNTRHLFKPKPRLPPGLFVLPTQPAMCGLFLVEKT